MLEPRSYQRILVYDVTGSGKTTLARRISEIKSIPWHSVDDLTFMPGWIQVPVQEQRRRIEAICTQPSWILDTAYGTWLEIPLAHANLIVALDYPRWLSFGRLLKRTAMRLVDGKTICNGNRETLATFFSWDSILLWHFKSFRRKHERIEKWSNGENGVTTLRFRHPRETERWLRSL